MAPHISPCAIRGNGSLTQIKKPTTNNHQAYIMELHEKIQQNENAIREDRKQIQTLQKQVAALEAKIEQLLVRVEKIESQR
jgi:predicted RNase H-like nuclease (RuvC/YqgF family)